MIPTTATFDWGDQASHVPAVAALVLGVLFLGRAGGALWWHYRHSATHPSAKGDISSLRCVGVRRQFVV